MKFFTHTMKYIFGILLIIGALLFFRTDISEANSPYFRVVQEQVPVLENKNGNLVQVGSLTKGQTFKITKDYGTNWWQIQFGNVLCYVYKGAVEPVKTADYANANTKYKNSTTTITTSKDVPVYDNTSGSLVQFATIKQNITFPILLKSGNWYAIDLNGRIGYVHNTGAKENVPPKSPPTAPVSNIIYIQAIKDAPIYDNRRDKLDEFATLKKGQSLQVTKDYGKNWWQVKWGNTHGYIEKSSVTRINNQTFKNVNSKYKTTTKHIVTMTNNVPVMDNTSGKLEEFALLKANHRYPIIGTSGNWFIIDIGDRYGYVHNTKATITNGIPVLMYHHILDMKELGTYKGVSTTITTEQFQREMNYLARQGFETITTDTLLKYIQGKINLPANAVAITFDDGLLSTRENAYPFLKKYGFKATQYLITARNYGPTQVFRPTGGLQFYSREDKAKMSDVWDYQSHTYNFHNLVKGKSDVIAKPYKQLIADLQRNKRDLPNSKSFSYPFGQYNATTIKALKELKYTNAVTTKVGYANIGDDPYQIKRFGIYQHTSFEEFKKIVHGRK